MDKTLSKELRDHPVAMYLNSLQSQASKKTMLLALRRALATKEAPMAGITGADVFNFPWPTVTQSQIIELSAAMDNRGLSPATISQTLTAVKKVMGHCFDMKMITGDELMRIQRVKNPKVDHNPQTGRYVPVEEMDKLKAVIKADETPAGKRDLAIIGWMWQNGPRSGEVCGAALRDFNPKTGEIIIRHGKGDKSRLNRLHNGALDAMNSWIETRGSWPGPLFVKLDKHGNTIKSETYLKTNTINKMLQKRIRQSKIDHCSPHDFRRTFVTDEIKNNGIRNAQLVVGHSSSATTSMYDRAPIDEALQLAGDRQF